MGASGFWLFGDYSVWFLSLAARFWPYALKPYQKRVRIRLQAWAHFSSLLRSR